MNTNREKNLHGILIWLMGFGIINFLNFKRVKYI